MKFLIGIDGGGTKTAFLLASADGTIIRSERLATTNHIQCGFVTMGERLHKGVYALMEHAGVSAADILEIAVCTPGYTDAKADDLEIERVIAKQLAGLPYHIYNDAENAHRGALLGRPGINIIAGTGSISYGINGKNQSARCGGWNHLFGGDEGSAYWLGCRLILEFTRESDHRDPKTLLYQYLREKLNLNDDGDIIVRTVEDMKFQREVIAQFSQDVSVLAARGDEACLKILDDGAFQLAQLAEGLTRQITFDKPILVTGTGGVFKAGDLIIKPLSKYLKNIGGQWINAAYEPDKGSVIVAAIDAGLTISDDFLGRLKLG